VLLECVELLGCDRVGPDTRAAGLEERMHVADKLARDLWRYITPRT
jgi:hypothetical protein